MSANDPLRIAIVGCGAISTQHIEAIEVLEETLLAGVVDASVERARETGQRRGVPWSTRIEDLLQRDDVDSITVCTPSGLHSEKALAALQAGKHVLVEKPISLSVGDADALIREARARERVLATVSQRRFEGATRALHDVVAAGTLGRLALIIVEGLYRRPQSYYDSAAWRGTRDMDGGVLMNQAIHMVDLMRWVGGPVASVAAHVSTLGHVMEAEDTATVSVRFANGTLGEIVATTCANPEFATELRVYGDRGHVRIVGETVVEWDVPGTPAPSVSAVDLTPPPGTGVTQTWGTNAVGYLRQYADFVDAVRSGRPPMVTGEDGRNAVELITAAYESDRSGRAVLVEGGRR